MDANAVLTQAAAKLQQRDPEAVRLFASVTRSHDIREAWLGLAAAHYLHSEADLAAKALVQAFSRHAIGSMPPFADSIAVSLRAPGWCALDGGRTLAIRLVQSLDKRSSLNVSLDEKSLSLRAQPDGRVFTAALPANWRQAREITAFLDGVPLLGSPIMLRTIGRVEGFVDTVDGNLQGWAWFPNDPDCDPELSITPLSGGRGITVVAEDRNLNIVSRTPLARPRGFHISAEQLRCFGGLISVCGPDGRHLIGSPLDPSAERRSAEAAARIVARLVPAPGQVGIALGDLLLPSVPAHLKGGKAQGGSKQRLVDVIVPVYGGLDLTLACLESVLVDLPQWARVVVVDDASPDPRVGQELAMLAARRRITLLTQEANRGFPGAANIGMCHDATRDIVLLNSDTLVPPGWLTRLREAAYTAADIATVTPLSNDATILSYPSIDHANVVPDLSGTIRLDALAQVANRDLVVDIPTAIGFCVYIKRDCLNVTGLFREDIFAQGYGEENDFCIRARHLGWRHVALPSVFVAHVGGQSFGAAKHYLIERNMGKLNQLHPGYDALIQAFQKSDPMAEPRRRLDLARWQTVRTRARSVLLMTHGRSGGVQRHVTERASALRAEGLRPIVLWPAASGDGARACVVGDGPEGGTPNLRFKIPGELDLLVRLLKAARPLRGEVHHMIGHDHEVMGLFRQLDIPYEIVVHDYSWMCPRINLVGVHRRYCGEPDLTECEACVAAVGTQNDEDTPPRLLCERSAAEMAAASRVIVPSEEVAIRIKRHFPFTQPKIIPWEDDSRLPPLEATPIGADGIRRVCIVGAIGIEKGYDIFLACARDAADRQLALEFRLVGYSSDDDRLLSTGKVYMTGRYDEPEAVSLIKQQKAQLAWLPSLWPETWCYTLTQAWEAGLNVMAFDIGTPAERIRRTGRGWVYPLGLSPQALNNCLLTQRPTAVAGGTSSFRTPRVTAA